MNCQLKKIQVLGLFVFCPAMSLLNKKGLVLHAIERFRDKSRDTKPLQELEGIDLWLILSIPFTQIRESGGSWCRAESLCPFVSLEWS